jgi:hypothetical protein
MIATPSLELWLRGETINAGVTPDSSGKGNHATVIGATIAAGKVGNCLSFDGINDYGEVADNADFSFTDGTNDLPFTIAFWVKFNSITNRQWLMSKRDTTISGANEWQITLYDGINGNKFSCYLWKNDSSAYIGKEMQSNLTANIWYHCAVTYDGSKSVNGIKLYLNSILQATNSKTLGSYTGMSNTNSRISFGYLRNVANTFFGGLIDEMLVCKNYEAPESDIKRIYCGLHPLNG